MPLTLIAAGPGWGKTVLLSEWAEHREDPVVWLSLDPGDDHEEAFWGLFRAAMSRAGLATELTDVAGDHHTPADPLMSSGALAIEVLSRHLEGRPSPLVLVLDNFHFISSIEVLETISSLILNPLPNLRMVMAVRRDPLLPIHRVRVAGQLAELRARDVAMDAPEIGRLLSAHGVDLSTQQQATLATRTEGWAAGLKLSVLRMEGRDDPAAFITEFALDQGSIGEYLTLEVLASQTVETRHALIRTSIADEICGSLVNAITGGSDGDQVLQRLAQTNSFVTTDREGVWYRYHPLLLELLKHLRANDSPEMQVRLHRRAAHWYDEHGRLMDGLRHALNAGDWSHALDMLQRGGLEVAFLRNGRQPLEGIDRLVDAASPDLTSLTAFRTSAIRAAVAGLAGMTARARSLLGQLRARPDSPDEPGVEDERSGWADDATAAAFVGLAELMLAYRDGDLEAVEEAATRLESAGDRPLLIATAKGVVGAARYWSGSISAAEPALRASVETAVGCGAPAIAIGGLGMLTMLAATQGKTDVARQAAEQGMSFLRSSPGIRGGSVAPLHLGYAHLALLRGDLDAYRGAMRRTNLELDTSHDHTLRYCAGLLEAKALTLAGQYQQAQDLLSSDSLASMANGFNLPGVRQILLSEIVVALGRPATAIKSLATMELNVPHLPELAHARADLELGEFDRAEKRIRRVVSSSAPAAPLPVLLDAVLLGAIVAESRGEEAAAAEAVSRAIDLGTVDGLVMPFIEAGPRLGALLGRHAVLAARWPGPPPEARAATTTRPGLVRQRSVDPTGPAELFEQLTERELSVLRWLTTTMTIAEIADELFVSINTVKTHLAAVYRKLGAAKRREAIDRAHELQLI